MEVREELSNEKEKDVNNKEKQTSHEELNNEKEEDVDNMEKQMTHEKLSNEKEKDVDNKEKQTTHEYLSNEKEDVSDKEKQTTHEDLNNEKEEDINNKEKQTTHEEISNEKEENINNEEKQTTPEEENDDLVTTSREEAPTHYILEIESLPFLMKILSQSRLNRYESTEFEVSGYNWRLILEFEEEKNPGKGDYEYLSFKLEMMGTQNLGKVDALLNLLLYVDDDEYISLRDGKVKQFKKEKKEWGLYRRAPVEFFIELEETFKVGVEIFVLRNEAKGECFTTLMDHFVWKMGNFSEMKQMSLFSQDFTIGDYKWKLRLYPRGVPKVKEEYLSIYLFLQDSKKVPMRSKIYVEFKLRINDQHNACNSKRIEKSGNAWFSRSACVWGFPYFIKLADLKERKGLIVDDRLIFGAEINSISIIKNLPPDTL